MTETSNEMSAMNDDELREKASSVTFAELIDAEAAVATCDQQIEYCMYEKQVAENNLKVLRNRRSELYMKVNEARSALMQAASELGRLQAEQKKEG